jgi:very-short-patch-repair endonuclease
MKAQVLPLMLVAIAMITLLALAAAKSKKRSLEQPRARRPLTANEQKMFFRLQQALPERIVLAQVSFSALLNAKNWATRNTFNRKMADFVICDRAFTVLAVVELDDSSHDGRKTADASRDALLEAAGYKVLRWRGIPDATAIQAALPPQAPLPQ